MLWNVCDFQEPLRLLDVPLLCRSTEKPGMIDTNFPGSELVFLLSVHTHARTSHTCTHIVVSVGHHFRVFRDQPITCITTEASSPWSFCHEMIE